jgi:sugar phosphate isomerase/epimerase
MQEAGWTISGILRPPMNRRELLHAGVIATLTSAVLGDATLARSQSRAARAASDPAAAPPPIPRRLIMDAYTRHLHWIRSADEIAETAIAMTCGGVNPTIQAPPGHIDPANVATALPAFVKTMQKHGLRVRQVRGGNQTQVDAGVETTVGTMAQLGVTHYWLGTDFYDLSKPIVPQLDAIKAKVERFVALNRTHGTTLMYHTRAGANAVGAAVWDLLYVLKDFDPAHVGLHWDTGHMALHGANMWELLMRTAGPYVAAIGWKDRSWERRDEPPGTGRGGGWSSPYVPMGTGLVDIARCAVVMRDIGFDGPMELEAEYPNGGAENGADTITLPRTQVVENLTRDVRTIRAGLQSSGTGLAI